MNRSVMIPSAGILVTFVASAAGELAQPVEYELGPGTSFAQGCYDPCACPIWMTDDVSGTFTLTPVPIVGPFETFLVDDVDWTVGSGELAMTVTGSGEYTIFSEFAVMHRLELDLSIDGAEPQHFDSEMIVGGQSFPHIDIAVSVNGFFCFDTAFFIDASPVESPAADLDGDGGVGFSDLLILLSSWGACNRCAADLDGNGSVDFQDLLTLLAAWS